MSSTRILGTKKPVLPPLIRVSSGSAIVLGLLDGFLNAKPTTAYLLTYLEGKCTANCSFCPQAKFSSSRADLLSRVTWPIFTTDKVLPKVASASGRAEIKRVCVQALNYPTVVEDLLIFVRESKLAGVDAPISVSCQPLNRGNMEKLAKAGVERIGIPLDAATKGVFDRVKGVFAHGPYDWNRQHETLLKAVEIFGRQRVSTHLIVGLGETEKEMIEKIQWCSFNGILPSLFAFTPIPGTAFENHSPPSLSHYRRVQLARHLVVYRLTKLERMRFDKEGHIIDFGVSEKQLDDAVLSGKPFQTSGCPNCNRPYYNEKPSGPLYNFPTQPTLQEIEEIEATLK